MFRLPSKIIRPRLLHRIYSGSLRFGPRARPLWLRVLVAGCALVVASGVLVLADSVTAVTPARAFSSQTRQAGAEVFKTKGCEHCHGMDAIGTDRGPELQDIGKRWKKDHIEQQIRNGGGGMPPFGDALQPDEVKDLVDYLSARKKAPKKLLEAPLIATPKPSASDDTGI